LREISGLITISLKRSQVEIKTAQVENKSKFDLFRGGRSSQSEEGITGFRNPTPRGGEVFHEVNTHSARTRVIEKGAKGRDGRALDRNHLEGRNEENLDCKRNSRLILPSGAKPKSWCKTI